MFFRIPRGRKLCGRNLRDCRGSITVQTALSFPIFFMLIMGIVQFSSVAYTKLNMQYALNEAARLMITGQGFNVSDPNARKNKIQSEFCSHLIASGLKCDANIGTQFTYSCVNPTLCSPAASCPAACTIPAGAPGQTVTVTVSFQKSLLPALFTKKGTTVTLRAKTTWKNEQFY